MIVYQNFEWDPREAATNLTAYGVSFKEAATVFAAEDVAITEDVESDRLHARGPSSRGRTLIVLHQHGPRIRILGAMVQQGEAKDADAIEGVMEQGDAGGSRVNEIMQSEAVEVEEESAEDVVAEVSEAEETNAPGANPVLGITVSTTEPHEAAVAQDAVEDVVATERAEVAEDEDAGALEQPKASAEPAQGAGKRRRRRRRRGRGAGAAAAVAAEPMGQGIEAEAADLRTSRIVDLRASMVETSVAKDIEERAPREDATAPVPEAADLAKTREDDVGKAVPEVSVVNDAAAAAVPEPPARPRRRIVPHRVRSDDAAPPAPAVADVAEKSGADDVKLEAKEMPAPEPVARPRRRIVPHRVRTSDSTPPAPEDTGVANAKTAHVDVLKPSAAVAATGNRIPGAGMTADEYGVYWDAYSAVRDEAKRQGKSLREAQRIGREAGDRAVAQWTSAPKAAEPAVKPAPKAPQPVAPQPAPKATKPVAPQPAAKATKPVAPQPAAKATKPVAPQPAAKAPKPTAKATKPVAPPKPATTRASDLAAAKPTVPEPMAAAKATRSPRKGAVSWRAAARAVK